VNFRRGKVFGRLTNSGVKKIRFWGKNWKLVVLVSGSAEGSVVRRGRLVVWRGTAGEGACRSACEARRLGGWPSHAGCRFGRAVLPVFDLSSTLEVFFNFPPFLIKSFCIIIV